MPVIGFSIKQSDLNYLLVAPEEPVPRNNNTIFLPNSKAVSVYFWSLNDSPDISRRHVSDSMTPSHSHTVTALNSTAVPGFIYFCSFSTLIQTNLSSYLLHLAIQPKLQEMTLDKERQTHQIDPAPL